MRVSMKDAKEGGLAVTFNGAPISNFLFADDTHRKIARLTGKDGQKKTVEILRGRVEVKAA